jgi:hypothetical protein
MFFLAKSTLQSALNDRFQETIKMIQPKKDFTNQEEREKMNTHAIAKTLYARNIRAKPIAVCMTALFLSQYGFSAFAGTVSAAAPTNFSALHTQAPIF